MSRRQQEHQKSLSIFHIWSHPSRHQRKSGNGNMVSWSWMVTVNVAWGEGGQIVKRMNLINTSPSILISRAPCLQLNSATKRTINAPTHKCIRSTGMSSRRYKIDKSQLRYKQLTRRYGTFYIDFLKTGIKSIR